MKSETVIIGFLCGETQCIVAFSYLDGLYNGTRITNITDVGGSIYYHSVKPSVYCEKQTGSLFAFFCFMLLAIANALIVAKTINKPTLTYIKQTTADVPKGANIVIGVSQDRSVVIVNP